jgi:hypothetical protein
MPKRIEELLKLENSDEIKHKIIGILGEYKEFALNFNEIQFNLNKERNLNIELGGKFYIYNILKDLIRDGKIKSVISSGTEYFYFDFNGSRLKTFRTS